MRVRFRDLKTLGFTLIELLVVISIVSLLASLALSSLAEARIKAENSHRNSMVLQYRNAFALYFASHSGQYPIPDSSNPSQTLVCLGQYDSPEFPGHSCGMVGSSVPPSTTLKQAISLYNPSFPAVSDKLVKLDNNIWLGAIYALCESSNPQCTAPYFLWYLQNDAQNCGPGYELATGYDPVSQQNIGEVDNATACLLVLKNL